MLRSISCFNGQCPCKVECNKPPFCNSSKNIHVYITGWWFTTLHLLCTPSIKTWYTLQQLFICIQ